MKRLCLLAVIFSLGLSSNVMAFSIVFRGPGMYGIPNMPSDVQRHFAVVASESDAGVAQRLRKGIVSGADALNSVVGDVEDALKITKGITDYDAVIAQTEGLSDLAKELAADSELLKQAGEYASVLSSVLDAIKWGNLLYELQDTLRADDRDAFGEAYSALVRELFLEGAKKLGQKGGAKIGVIGLKGGPLVLITVPIGYVAGGKIAEAAAGAFYDAVLDERIQEIGRRAHDRIHGVVSGDSGASSDVPPGPSPVPSRESGRERRAPVQLPAFR